MGFDSLRQLFFLEWLAGLGIADITTDESLMKTDQSANAIVTNPKTLEDLRKIVAGIDVSFRECALNMVFGVGNPQADILLLGEAPGAEEDRQGVPFVGQSGQLLDKMLAAINLDRSIVYITNIIPWRPPGNRTPTLQEVALFRPYVLQHIRIVNPKIVVCLGSTATKALTQINQSLTQSRGKWIKISELDADIMATFHPAYLLRSPSQKKEAWHDFLSIRARYSEIQSRLG
ncbi:MAG: uracil-DNA glycosylase [Holosporaceae bacterium]|jgi:DNA polymerase|nr:uracil-DNA glycosylase [Holosporaceae bacterium]